MKKNWYKGLTATAISLAMAGAAVSVPAFAIEYDLANGDVNVGVNADTGSVESWQTDGTDEFYYALNSETGAWDTKTNGRYQHTQPVTVIDEETKTETVVEKTDNDVIITQSNPGTATDNTVKVSGDLKGDDTTAADDVDITINGVNVETDGTFLTVKDNTVADITIGEAAASTADSIDSSSSVPSTVVTGDNAITIGANSDIDLTLDDVSVTLDLTQNTDFSAAGIYVKDGSDLDLYLSGTNTFDVTGLEDLQGRAFEKDVPANNYHQVNIEGIRVGGNVSDWGGDAAAPKTTIDISKADNVETGVLNMDGFGTGMVVSANADAVVENGSVVNITNATATSSTQSGRGAKLVGGLTVTGSGTKFNISEVHKGDFVIANDTGSGLQDKNSGWGIDNQGKGITVSNGASLKIADLDAGGIYFSAGHMTIENGSTVEIGNDKDNDYNGYNGMSFEGSSTGLTVGNKSSLYVRRNAKNGIQSDSTTRVLMTIDNSRVVVEKNKSTGVLNVSTMIRNGGMKEASLSVLNNGAHGWSNGYFDIYDSVADFNNNGGRGLNVSAIDTSYDENDRYTHIVNSTINANDNGGLGCGSIVFQKDALIKQSTVNSNNCSNGDGIIFVNQLLFDHAVVTANGSSRDGINGFFYWGKWDRFWNFNNAHPVIVGEGSTITTVNNKQNGFHTYSDLTVDGGTFISYGNGYANLYLDNDLNYDRLQTLYASFTKTYYEQKVPSDCSQIVPNFYVYDNSAVVLDGRAQSNKVVAGPAANKEGANIVAGKGSKVTITGGSMYADSRKINVDVTNGGEKVYLTVLDNDSAHNAFKVVSNDVYGVAAGETEYHGNRNPADIYKTIYDYLNRAGANADGKIYVWTPLADVNYYLDLDGDGEYTKADYVTENVIRGTSLAFMVGSGTLDDNMSFVANNPFIPADATFGEIPEGFFITWYDAATGEERTVFGVAGQAPDYPIYGDTDVYAELTEAPKEPEEPYFPPYQPDPKPDPKPVEPEVPDVPEEPTPVQPEEPVTPSIPDEVIDDIIDEVEQLTSVPQTGAEEEADDYAAAAVPAGVLALAVAGLLRRKRRAE